MKYFSTRTPIQKPIRCTTRLGKSAHARYQTTCPNGARVLVYCLVEDLTQSVSGPQNLCWDCFYGCSELPATDITVLFALATSYTAQIANVDDFRNSIFVLLIFVPATLYKEIAR